VGSTPIDEKPIHRRGKNGSEVAQALLTLVHGCGVAVHFVADAKSRRIIAETNGALIMGARVTHYIIIADADNTLSRLRHWLFARASRIQPMKSPNRRKQTKVL
jgi:hypothetical protein